jgi:hypothetical protein
MLEFMNSAIAGACHCGLQRLIFRTNFDPAALPARLCECGFCRRHAPLYVSDPVGQVLFRAGDDKALTRYRFGTHTAEFPICSICGTLLFAKCHSGGSDLAVVNGRILEGVTVSRIRNAQYDDESEAARMDRRRRTWTPLLIVPDP